MKPVLGIDFGTTHASAALGIGREVKMVPQAGGGVRIPSVVAFPPAAVGGGPPLVGPDALVGGARHPERTIVGVMRLLGRKIEAPEVRHHRQAMLYDLVAARNGDARVRVGRRHHAPQDIAAYVLGALRAAAERMAGEVVTGAVLAVPALFDDLQRQAMRDAARIAGLDVLGLVNTSSAAALGSGLYPAARGEERKVLVYDLGGGAFDVAALVIDDARAEVVASGGDPFLGGEDFDQRIVSHICDEILGRDGSDLRKDRPLLVRLKQAAENAKHQLSVVESVDIRVAASGARAAVSVRLDRARLETLTQDLVDRTIWSCEAVLRDAKWSDSDNDLALLVVGGQSLMPRIRQQLADLVPRAALEIADPASLVALGAARQALALTGVGRGRAKGRSAVTERTCLSLGVEAAGGIFTRLIPRATPLPATRTQVFSTSTDGQTQIVVHLLQGEREMAADNESVARIQIGPIAARPRGEPQIEIEISTDGGGLPRVTARDLAVDEVRQIRIRPSAGLSEAEIVALATAHAGGPTQAGSATLAAEAMADDLGANEADATQATQAAPTATVTGPTIQGG